MVILRLFARLLVEFVFRFWFKGTVLLERATFWFVFLGLLLL